MNFVRIRFQFYAAKGPTLQLVEVTSVPPRLLPPQYREQFKHCDLVDIYTKHSLIMN